MNKRLNKISFTRSLLQFDEKQMQEQNKEKKNQKHYY